MPDNCFPAHGGRGLGIPSLERFVRSPEVVAQPLPFAYMSVEPRGWKYKDTENYGVATKEKSGVLFLQCPPGTPYDPFGWMREQQQLNIRNWGMSSLVESLSPRKFPIATKDRSSDRSPSESESYLRGAQLSCSDRFAGLYGYKSWMHRLVVRRGFLPGEVCKESKGSQFSGHLEQIILDHF